MNASTITVTGNVTADSEARVTPSGHTVTNFTIAQTPRRKVDGEWTDDVTIFWRCELWGDAGEHAAGDLTRGTRVIVTGTLRGNTWEDKYGQQRHDLILTVDEVGPSRKFAPKPAQRADSAPTGW